MFCFVFLYFHIFILQIAGVSQKDLIDILPTSLIHGYGEKVCTFLLLLCSLALIKTNHTWAPLIYKNLIKNDAKNNDKDDHNENNKRNNQISWREDVRFAFLFLSLSSCLCSYFFFLIFSFLFLFVYLFLRLFSFFVTLFYHYF